MRPTERFIQIVRNNRTLIGFLRIPSADRGMRSEDRSHAMSRGENSSDHQSQKITGLKDGLHDHDRQCCVEEAEAAAD